MQQRYRVQLSYRVDTTVAADHAVLDDRWGPGLQRSRVDRGVLSVIVVTKAWSPHVAARLVDLRVRRIWRGLGHAGPQLTFVDVRTARRLVLAGRVLGGERLVSDSLPRRDDRPDDDGGSAGVREPRRPLPAPPSLSMALVEPRG